MMPPPVPARPPAWLPDPLDESLLRYWDGHRWTFHTVARSARPLPATPPPRTFRPDVAAALERMRGARVGTMTKIALLPDYLQPEERVLALAAAQGDGLGVLACTNRRLLFLFAGLLQRQFRHVDWNTARAVVYNHTTRTFAGYTREPGTRAVPAMVVRIDRVDDAEAVACAARAASAVPRLDVV
ncbi:DUF2510 domain-containing protein [Saccharopolyspora thermophila]|nr:DUF2510 domain-containing protein [Saccharopolyspora subtropica]